MEPLLGEIKIFAGSFAPKGWMLCQGQLFSISQYTALFSIIGTTYGGDGQTTFQLPNLGGRTPLGTGNSPGTSRYEYGQLGGTENVTINTQQMPAHTHNININTEAPTVGLGTSAYLGYNADPQEGTPLPFYSDKATSGATLNSDSVTPAGGNQPVNIVTPYLAMNYIIAIEGIYPSRP